MCKDVRFLGSVLHGLGFEGFRCDTRWGQEATRRGAGDGVLSRLSIDR